MEYYTLDAPIQIRAAGESVVTYKDTLNTVEWTQTTAATGEFKIGTPTTPNIIEAFDSGEVDVDALRLRDTLNKITLSSGALSASYSVMFPPSAPTTDQYMKYDGTRFQFHYKTENNVVLDPVTLTGVNTICEFDASAITPLTLPSSVVGQAIYLRALSTSPVVTINASANFIMLDGTTPASITINPNQCIIIGHQGSGVWLELTDSNIDIGAISATGTANGATFTGNLFQLHQATDVVGGVLTAADQTIGGSKTCINNINVVDTTDATHGNFNVGSMRIHNYSPFGTKNIYIGELAGRYSPATGTYNIGIGTEALRNVTSGQSNICIGHGTSSLTSGYGNVLLNGGGNMTTGGRSVCIGLENFTPAGNEYTTESNNIAICNPGVVGESGTIRIGGLSQSQCFVSGVFGVSGTSGEIVTAVAGGKLGTIPQYSFGAIDASANANGGSITGSVITLNQATATTGGVVTNTTQTISGNKTFSGTISASNLSNTNTGDVTLAAVGVVPNANGASLSGQVLTLQPADGTNPGLVSTTTQTFAGNKTFTGTIAASNLSNTNTGDVTLAVVGAVPNANGASLSGQVLTLQSADGTNPGLVNITTQTFAGNKTFTGTISASNFSGSSSGANTGDVTLAATGSTPNANGASLSGQVLTLQPADGTNSGLMSTTTQTLAGNKTFTGTISASNLSNTNTGDITLATVGVVPNADGASLSGQVLTLQPADGTFGGVLTNTTQNIAGAKTFTGAVTVSGGDITITNNNLALPASASLSSGTIYIGGIRNFHTYSTSGTKTNVFVGGNSGNYTNSGTGNTCVGSNSGTALTSGVDNCLIGSFAGNTITSTSNNVMIANAGTAGISNTIRVGNSSHTSAAMFGISGATSTAGVAVLVNASGVLGTTTSSERYKNTINDVSHSKLAKLHELRVVDFYYNEDKEKKQIQNGLIAEECERVFPEMIVYEEDGIRPQTIMYHQLWPLLLKELQEQKKLIETLTQRLKDAGIP